MNDTKHRVAVFATASLLLALAPAARSADYNWTGGAGNGLWSDAGNWTNETGAAVAPVATTAASYSFFFPVGDAGLSVVDDIAGTVIVKSLSIGRTGTGAAAVEVASQALGCVIDFSSNATLDIPEGATLVWKADNNRWNNQDFIKNGAGTVVFDFIRGPMTERGFVLNAGTAEVAATSADPLFHVKIGGRDASNIPVFRNLKDGGTVGALNTMRLGGTADIGATTLHVGAAAQSTHSGSAPTNVLPAVEGAGTLVFQNERVSRLSEFAPSFGVSIDRADLVAPDFGADICWLFDDASAPTADAIGSGARMAVSGTPAVVSDAERGSVLSLSGGALFKGPDANQWLDGFDPSAGYTVAFWIKPAANCDPAGKIFFLGTAANAQALAIRLNNSTTAGLMVTAWGGNQTPEIGDLRDGAWHHVAVTYDGKPQGSPNMRLYVDGENAHSWSAWNYAPQRKDLYIGNMAGTAWANAGGNNPYTGLLDDFVLASRCLTPHDVAALVADGPASVVGIPQLGDVAAESSGTLAVEASALSAKTLSGDALVGGVEMLRSGSTLVVGSGAPASGTLFKGAIRGDGATLVKEGADYTLALSGAAPGVTGVIVNAGTLALRRPRARAGLAAWYPFDDAGDFGSDAAPGGLALSVEGDSAAAFASVADGVSGGAVRFPGGAFLAADAKIEKPSNFPRGNGSFTVSAWIRPTAAACTGTVPIFSWGDPADEQLSMVRFNGANAIDFTTWGGGNDLALGGLPLSDGAWHHLVVTYDGPARTKKMYYDGTLKGTKVLSADLDVGVAKNSFEIGHTSVIPARANQYYTGDMDEFVVCDYAWDADEVAAEFAKVPPSAVAAASLLPVPVAHWTFDGADPLAAEGGDPALALSETSGTVAFESGDAICGKAARFSASSGFLALDAFPTGVIPSGNAEFTVVVRYRPDTRGGAYNASVVGWGDNDGWSAGTLFRIASGEYNPSAQAMFRSTTLSVGGTSRTDLGTDRTRWYTVAASYQEPGFDGAGGAMRLFVDGEPRSRNALWGHMALAERDFAIGSNVGDTRRFLGLVDDVQIYDKNLSAGQIRMIAEQLEASKGQATTGKAIPEGVLSAHPDVTVAAGATLRVESAETIGNLSGEGSVEIAPLARLDIASALDFAGAVSGDGLLGIADGAVLDIGDGSAPLFVCDGPVALGANVTVRTTATQGRVTIATAHSFARADNLESWTVAAPGNRPGSVLLSADGKSLYLSLVSPTVIFFR